tara:strand:+ start:170 stop:1072 length:903 start_codon:yes stop_codon:yes gene_type:complete
MSDFTLSQGLRDRIHEINWDVVSKSGSEKTEIDDFGDYAIVENFFETPDDFWSAIEKCPAGWNGKEAEAAFKEGVQTPEPAWPGIKQLIPSNYLRGTLYDLYKIFIECEFIPHDLDTNLDNPQFAFELPRYALTYAELIQQDSYCSKNANQPSPGRFDYVAVIFREDNPNHGISFFDLVYKGEHYSDVSDLAEIQDENVIKGIQEALAPTDVQPETVKFEKFDGSDVYVRSRFIEAKKNRVILFKGSKWHTYEYNGEGDYHTVTIALNNPPKPKELDGNEFENRDDDRHPPQLDEDPLYV